MRRLLALVALTTMTACTPAQLATLERLYGDLPDRKVLALPDAPGTLPDGSTLHLDGRISRPVAPAGSSCPQHYGAALAAGWRPNEWANLDRIMYRESRCDPMAHNNNHATRDDSRGLVQINLLAHRSWVGPMIGWDFSRLHDPVTNLRVARTLYLKCGWGPWTKPYWCSRPY